MRNMARLRSMAFSYNISPVHLSSNSRRGFHLKALRYHTGLHNHPIVKIISTPFYASSSKKSSKMFFDMFSNDSRPNLKQSSFVLQTRCASDRFCGSVRFLTSTAATDSDDVSISKDSPENENKSGSTKKEKKTVTKKTTASKKKSNALAVSGMSDTEESDIPMKKRGRKKKAVGSSDESAVSASENEGAEPVKKRTTRKQKAADNGDENAVSASDNEGAKPVKKKGTRKKKPDFVETEEFVPEAEIITEIPSPTSVMKSVKGNMASSNGSILKGPQNYVLSPSDFAFLFDTCKRCYYLKVTQILNQPRLPFPSIFNQIDTQMKMCFRGLLSSDLMKPEEMPVGTILCEEEDALVECKPISVPGHKSTITIRGKLDAMMSFEDGTFGVIDFKTSNVSGNLEKYSRQLHAYAFALEDPSEKSQLSRCEISTLGLLVFEPMSFTCGKLKSGQPVGDLSGPLKYIPIIKNNDQFMKILKEILDILEQPEPPVFDDSARYSCEHCKYLRTAAGLNLIP